MTIDQLRENAVTGRLLKLLCLPLNLLVFLSCLIYGIVVNKDLTIS